MFTPFYFAFMAEVTSKDRDLSEGERDSVTGALLNRCPEPIMEDLKMAVMLLRDRNAAAVDLVTRSGVARQRNGDVSKPEVGTPGSFREDFRVTCADVDALMASLEEDEKLTPRLEGHMNVLRTQFGALTYYFQRMGAVRNGDIDECIALLQEMRDGGRYKERIFPNITLVRVAMRKTMNANQSQRLYEHVMNDTYGEEKVVCKPDEKFFELWFEVCMEPAHFEELYKAMKMNGFLKNIVIVAERWGRNCESPEEFEGFFNNVISDKVVQPNNQFFMAWLARVESSDQWLKVIEAIFKTQFVPDNILIKRISQVAWNFGGDGRALISGLHDIYIDGANGELASSQVMLRLYQNLKQFFSL